MVQTNTVTWEANIFEFSSLVTKIHEFGCMLLKTYNFNFLSEKYQFGTWIVGQLDFKFLFLKFMAMHFFMCFCHTNLSPKIFFRSFDFYTSKKALLLYNGKLKICNVKFGQYCRMAEKHVKYWKFKKIRPLYMHK